MDKIKPIKIVVIIGPTASGKSDLAIKITKKFNGEIISADSRQVYRGMDIGTGKVPRDSKLQSANRKAQKRYAIGAKRLAFYSKGVKHHLIDVASPKKQFTADDFKRQGQKAINDILNRGKTPIIVGGTGFYIDVLLGRMSVAEVPPNKKLRKKLGNLEIEKLFEMLRKLDPQRAKTIEAKNKRRLIRALEIAVERRGLNVESCPKTTCHIPHSTFKTLWLGLNPGKEKLAKKIKERLDARLKQGMVKEIVNLRKQEVSWKRLDNFGLEYRWISRWLKKSKFKISDSKFLNSDEYQNLLRDINKYSKRQMTWFKRNKEIKWIANRREAIGLVKKFLAQ